GAGGGPGRARCGRGTGAGSRCRRAGTARGPRAACRWRRPPVPRGSPGSDRRPATRPPGRRRSGATGRPCARRRRQRGRGRSARSSGRGFYHPRHMTHTNVQVTGLDHVVLLVEDTERTLAWYCGELGLAGERVEEWRNGKVFFPSVRIDATTLIDVLPRAPGAARAPEVERNVDHLCL